MKRATLLIAVCLGCAAPALADPALTIPPLQVDPNPQPSAWNGLYVGGGVSAAAIKGAKAGFGSDLFAGYDKRFADNLVLGIKLDTGFAPLGLGRYRGFDYTTASAKIGYDIGRFTPYVYAGGGIARATAFPSELPDAAATLNGAFGQGPGFGIATFGAGVDYHVTNNLTVGVAAGVFHGPPQQGF